LSHTIRHAFAAAAVTVIGAAGLAAPANAAPSDPGCDPTVLAAALDAAKAGFTTTVLLDLCAGVAPETTERALMEMRAAGVHMA